MKDYIVVNFSGGKDSTAMLLRMIELGEHIDEVVCCDTTKEFPAMYRHIERVRRVVEGAGVKFTTIKAEHDFDHLMLVHQPKRRNPKDQHVLGYGWPRAMIRWCTTELKVRPTNNYFKELRKTHNLVQCIGLAMDEDHRLERANNQDPTHRHPLVEWGWTEADCLKYCYECGYDWDGLYDVFNRVSCWCCPLKSLGELRKLWKHYPELWEELKDMDKKSWDQFRAGYSVKDLEVRFQFEEERIAQGLSITNRDFHNQLKERLGKGGDAECHA